MVVSAAQPQARLTATELGVDSRQDFSVLSYRGSGTFVPNAGAFTEIPNRYHVIFLSPSVFLPQVWSRLAAGVVGVGGGPGAGVG